MSRAPRKKKRRLRISDKPVYRRRRRTALLVILLLAALPVSGPAKALLGGPEVAQAAVSRVEPPVFSTAPVALAGTQKKVRTPEDKTLYLTVPRLGIYGHTVRNDDSPGTLDRGAIKLPSTGFPWQDNANTYIAGHRIGYRGTESYYQFYDLPAMRKGDEVILEDSAGNRYVYRVMKIFAVEPHESWVTEPVPGKDMVTLQTCTESVEDWWTVGPELMRSGPDTGRLIVRAERAY